MKAKRERETKFEVPEGFDLAPVTAALEDLYRIETADLQLDSTYYDTPDHDLLWQRITLRRREGDDDTGWHLKVPSGIARTEVRLPLSASGDGVPEQLERLVAGVSFGKPFTAVATINTRRHAIRVHDAHQMLLELADDQVQATDLSEPTRPRAWREVEAELAGGGEDLL